MRSLRAFAVLFCLGLAWGGPGNAAENLPEIRADGDLITVDGEPIFLKGVCYSPFIAGDAPGAAGAPRNVNFQNDLNEIRNVLNANAVRVYDPLPKAFYGQRSFLVPSILNRNRTSSCAAEKPAG